MRRIPWLTRLLGFIVDAGGLVRRRSRRAASAQCGKRAAEAKRDQTLEDSFPASDPPSIGGVD